MPPRGSLIVKGPDAFRLVIPPFSLLVFIDDTGHEEFADPRYPVFGFGGCLTTLESYEDVLVRPWKALKKKHFGSETFATHSAEIAHSNDGEAKAAIGEFFRNQSFARFAAIFHRDTMLAEDRNLHEVAGTAVRDIIERVIGRITASKPIEGGAFIFEASERTDRLMTSYFKSVVLKVGGVKVPVLNALAPKSLGFEGLEIADLIAHTAGMHARRMLERPKADPFKNYQVVFESGHLAAYSGPPLAPDVLLEIRPREDAKPVRLQG